jgi:Protein involved in biosynthesis of mitomycin antibiotics/polyketide fumonisin
MQSLIGEFETAGFVWFRQALSESVCRELDDWFDVGQGEAGKRRTVAGLPESFTDVGSKLVSEIIRGAAPVRVVTFDKNAAANWGVPWHRDFVVTTDRKAEVDGFINWTQRDGVWHARPPISLLDHMFFLRILLDDTDENSGDLELLPGSHLGPARSTAHDFGEAKESGVVQTCGKRGDVLAAHALILHRSRAAASAKTRRSVRIDYCAAKLPTPLNWAN